MPQTPPKSTHVGADQVVRRKKNRINFGKNNLDKKCVGRHVKICIKIANILLRLNVNHEPHPNPSNIKKFAECNQHTHFKP